MKKTFFKKMTCFILAFVMATSNMTTALSADDFAADAGASVETEAAQPENEDASQGEAAQEEPQSETQEAEPAQQETVTEAEQQSSVTEAEQQQSVTEPAQQTTVTESAQQEEAKTYPAISSVQDVTFAQESKTVSLDVEAAEGVFENGTTISASDAGQSDAVNAAVNAVRESGKLSFLADEFNIDPQLNGQKVQPNGSVALTFGYASMDEILSQANAYLVDQVLATLEVSSEDENYAQYKAAVEKTIEEKNLSITSADLIADVYHITDAGTAEKLNSSILASSDKMPAAQYIITTSANSFSEFVVEVAISDAKVSDTVSALTSEAEPVDDDDTTPAASRLISGQFDVAWYSSEENNDETTIDNVFFGDTIVNAAGETVNDVSNYFKLYKADGTEVTGAKLYVKSQIPEYVGANGEVQVYTVYIECETADGLDGAYVKEANTISTGYETITASNFGNYPAVINGAVDPHDSITLSQVEDTLYVSDDQHFTNYKSTEQPEDDPNAYSYKIEGSDSVSLSTIIAALQSAEESTFPKDFELVSSGVVSGKATISSGEDPVVTVPGGGNQKENLIYVVGDDNVKRTIYVYSDQTKVTDRYITSQKYRVIWNDNKDEQKVRPTADADTINSNYSLQVTVDGETFDISQITEKTGITTEDLGFDPENFQIYNYLDKENTTFIWTFDFTDSSLPSAYMKDGKTHTISYSVVQKNEYDKYELQSEDNVATADYTDSIINVVDTDYTASIIWKDNDNKYGTRPEVTFESFTAYVRNSNSDEAAKEITLKEENLQIVTDEETGTVTITIVGMPAFDEDGNELMYSLVPSITAKESTEGDYYAPTYENKRDFASYSDSLYNGGTVTELLTNTVDFTYSKYWKDGKTEEERPDTKIYLYVASEDAVTGVVGGTYDPNTASAVQGYTSQAVPKEDENIDIELVQGLPLYDESGARVIYFGLETGLVGNYISAIDNTNSVYSDQVEQSMDLLHSSYVNTETHTYYPKYVLNGGTITNRLSDYTVASVTKVVYAASLQSSKNIKVNLALQKLVEDESTGAYTWQAVTYGDYLVQEDDYDPTAPVVETVDSFSVENNTTVSLTSEGLPKYDANGNVIKYRWTETDVTIGGEDLKSVTWNDTDPISDPGNDFSYETTADVDLGKYAPGVGNTDVSAFLSGTSDTTISDGTSDTYIQNYINAPATIDVTKTWIDENGINVTQEVGEAGGYIQVQIYCDGEPYKDADGQYVYATLNAENYDATKGCWELQLTGYDRFDETGHEYVYSVRETAMSAGSYDPSEGWGSDITYKNEVVNLTDGSYPEGTNAKQVDAAIANGIGPGDSVEIVAEKEWIDDSDLTSRKPVYVGVFNTENGYMVGNRTYELNDTNGWYVEIGIAQGNYYYTCKDGQWVQATDDSGEPLSVTAEDIAAAETSGSTLFAAIEIGIGSTTDASTMHIYDDANYTAWTQDQVEEIVESLNPAKTKFGMVASDDADPSGNSEYTYEVYGRIGETARSGKTGYIWTNKRIGTLSMYLTKSWTDMQKDRAAEFAVYKDDSTTPLFTFKMGKVNGTVTKILNYDSLPSGVTSEVVMDKDNTYQVKIKGLFDSDVVLTIKDNTDTDTFTASIEGLEKFDEKGAVHTYNMTETGMYDDEGVLHEVSGGSVTLDEDQYSASFGADKSGDHPDGYILSDLHHNNDKYYYVAKNSLTGSYNLNFYKVWYDDATAINERPNIYYKIYRASTGMSVNNVTHLINYINGTESDQQGNYYSEENFADYLSRYFNDPEHYSEQIELVKTVTADRLYDSDNKWLVQINIGQVEQYDEDGYPYLYFAVEAGVPESSAYYGNVFYGNMQSAQLAPAQKGESAKNVYDIYDIVSDSTWYENYGSNTVLVLSDGYHNVDGNEGQYYSRTIVNTRKGTRDISGKKLWKLPTGWTIPDENFPKVELQLYRTLQTVDTGDSSSIDLEKITDKELVSTFYLNSDTEDAHNFKNYTFVLSEDNDGNAISTYDKYGSKYTYFVVEPDTDDDGYQIPGYPIEKVVSNPTYSYVKNVYEIREPYVEISGEKDWAIDLTEEAAEVYKEKGIELKIKDLQSVDVSLYAQAVDENGDVIEDVDPILISTQSLDPADADADGKLTFNFTDYTEYEDYSASNPTKIPYYAGNGNPYKFYVTETITAGYDQKISVNGEALSTYTETTVKYIDLYPTDDTKKLYKNKTDDEGNDVVFSNTYTGEKKNFEVTKSWKDDYVDNDSLRPDQINLVIGRRTVKGIDSKFEMTATILKSDNPKSNSWKYTFKDLVKYDTKGNEYTYYIKQEEFADEDGTVYATAANTGDEIGSYTLVGKSNNTLTNQLTNSTKITAKKQWKYEVNDTGTVVNLNSWSIFKLLRNMNVLPQRVQYVVQKSVDGGAWTTVDGSNADSSHKINIVDADGNTTATNVLGYDVDIANMTASTFASDFNLNVTWEPLEKSDKIQYRVIENVIWKDQNTGENSLVTYVDSTCSGYGMASTFDTTAAEDGSKTVSIANTIKTKKVRLAKVWIDEKDQDNTRPSEITLTIKTKKTGDTTSYTLKTSKSDAVEQKDGKYYSYYYSDYFYLPAYYNLDDSQYEVSESTIDTGTYKQNVTFGSVEADGTYTVSLSNTLDQTRKLISVEAKKTWSYEGIYKTITRPYLKFTLQYKDQTTGTWTAFTNDTIKAFEVLSGTAEYDTASYIIAPTESDPKATWNNLKKYWDVPSVDGVAEPIQYRVAEELVNADGTALTNSSYTNTANNIITYTGWDDAEKYYFGTPADTGKYSGSITNTETRKPLYLQKEWTKNGSTTDKLTKAEIQKLVALKAVPEQIRFQIQYQLNGETTWNSISTLDSRYTGIIEKKTEDLTTAQSTGYNLPRYDSNGNLIQYRVRETAVKYSGDSEWTTISWGDADVQENIGSITVTQSTFDMPAANKTATLTNDYQYVEKEITKNWLDESNRDGVRADFSVTLNRDGSAYGTVNTGNDTQKTSQFVTVTKSDNSWVVKYSMLPKYKAGTTAAERTTEDESQYTWTESTIPSSYVIQSYDKDGTERTTVTNVYEPARGSISATKNWLDDVDWASLTRTEKEIPVKLQYRIGTSGTWTDITQNTLTEYQTLEAGVKKLYADGGVYTTSDAQQMIKYDSDSKTYSTVTWADLPTKVNTSKDPNTVTAQDVYYKVVEVSPSDISGYTFKSVTSKDLKIDYTNGTKITKDTTLETVVNNTLNYTTLNIKKTWTKNQTEETLTTAEINKLIELNVIPKTVAVKIEYSVNNSEWKALTTGSEKTLSMTDLISTNGVSLTEKLPKVDKDGNKFSYRVYETSVTYNNGNAYNVTWDDDKTSGVSGSMSTSAASAEAAAAGTVTNIALSNDYEYVSKEITKNWEDENNRDSARADFKVTLYRDGATYGKELSTADMTADKAIDAQWGIVTKTVEGNSNQWKISVDYLPKYKEGATTHSTQGESVYTWSETTVTANYAKENTTAVSTETAETNAYQPIRGNITVTKNWEDQDNLYDLRPTTIYVKLQWNNNGTWTDVVKGSTKTVNGKMLYSGDASQPYTTSDAGWRTLTVSATGTAQPTNTWNDLSKYVQVNSKATEVSYRVIEGVKVGDNIVEVDGSNKVPGYKVTNSANVKISSTASGTVSEESASVKNTQEVGKLTVSKTWKGSSSLITPKSVTFSVKATSTVNGAAVDADFNLDDITITSSDKWTKTVENLPVYDANGNEYTYTLTEASLVYSFDGKDVTIAVDGNNAGAYVTGTNPIQATRTTDPQTGAVTWTVNADNTIKTGDLTVSKAWNDEENRDGVRPSTVTITLKRDGTVVGKVTLGASEESSGDPMNIQTKAWSYKWTNLPLYKDNNQAEKSVYTVAEDKIDNYTVAYSANDISFNVDETTGNVEDASVDVTNTHTPNHFNIEGTKEWKDADDKYGVSWTELTFTLQYQTASMTEWANVETTPETADPTKVYTDNPAQVLKVTGTGKSRTLENQTVAELDKALWTNLPEYVLNSETGAGEKVYYQVKETVTNRGTANYQPKYSDPIDYSKAADVEGQTVKVASATVTNELDMSSITVEKTWVGDEKETKNRRPVTVVLKRDGTEISQVTLGADTEDASELMNITTNAWSYTWTDLPVAKKNGDASVYTIEESTDTVGYTVTYPSGKSVSINEEAAVLGITNTMDKGQIEVTKMWAGDVAEERPSSITFQLKRDGSNYGEAITVNKKDDGSFETAVFEDLPIYKADGTQEKSTYEVVETSISGYTTEYSATGVALEKYDAEKDNAQKITVTNTMKKGSIQVAKTWVDDQNRDNLRSTVTINLYRDGGTTPYRTWTSDVDGKQLENWTTIFKDLPMYQAGGSSELSVYTLEEVGQNSKYTVTWNDKSTYEYTVSNGKTTEAKLKNTYEAEKGSISIEKAWEDAENQYKLRPTSITFTLEWKDGDTWKQVETATKDNDNTNGGVYANEANPQTIKVTQTKGDKASWTNLPVNYQGKKITYRVTETAVGGYEAPVYTNAEGVEVENANQTTVTKDQTSELYVKNKLTSTSLTINKAWVDDSTWSSLVRPTEITYKVEYLDEDGNAYVLNSADGKAVKGIVKQTGPATGDWDAINIEGIPSKDSQGRDYTYRVSEIAIKYSDGKTVQAQNGSFTDEQNPWTCRAGAYNGQVTIAQDEDSKAWTATATNTLPKGDLNVTKNWADGNNRDGLRPTSVKLQLYRDGNTFGEEVTLGGKLSENAWTYSWDNLPIYKADGSGQKSEYYVVETAVDGYKTTYKVDVEESTEKSKAEDAKTDLTQDADVVLNITNTHTPQLFYINGRKAWEDSSNLYGMRPTEVTLKLQYSLNPQSEKSWKDVEHVDAVPTETEDDGEKIFTTSAVEQVIKGSGNTWTDVKWNDLPAYCKTEDSLTGDTLYGYKVFYRVVEVDDPVGYTKTVSDTISYNPGKYAKDDFTVTAKNTMNETSLTVNKVWDPDTAKLTQFNALPKSITAQLQYKNTNGEWVNVPKNSEVTIEGVEDASGAVTYTYTYEHLNAGYEYRAIETKVTYAEGDVAVVTSEGNQEAGTVGSFTYAAKTEKVAATETGKNDTYTTTITNTIPDTELEVTKTWDDEEDRDILRKDITVNLYRDEKLVDTVTLTKENGWTYKWTQLPMYQNGKAAVDGNESIYTIEEVKIDGYQDPKYKGNGENTASVILIRTEEKPGYAIVDITNIHNPQKGTISATKNWEDFSDFYGDRPESIYLTLKYKVEGSDEWQIIDKAELNSNNNYVDGGVHTTSDPIQKIEVKGKGDSQTAVWYNLPVTINDKDVSKTITYKVFETDADGTDIIGADQEGATLKNYDITYSSEGDVLTEKTAANQTITNTLEKTSLDLTKDWIDDEGIYSHNGKTSASLVRPYKIEFYVQYKGDSNTWQPLTQAGSTPISEDGVVTMTGATDGEWDAITIADLPLKTPNGEMYQYRVREARICCLVDDQEVWVDCKPAFADDSALETDENTVGAYLGQTGSVRQEDNTWVAASENELPVGSLDVSKVWNDGNNRDGVRPTEITLKLHMIDVINENTTDKLIDTVVVTMDESGNWSYHWDNLPVYTSDGSTKALYYVEEVSVDEYETTYTSEQTAAETTVETASASPDDPSDEADSSKPESAAVTVDGDNNAITVTNTHEPKLFNIDASKYWEDNDNEYGLRTDNVILTLEYSLDGGNTWLTDIAENTDVAHRPTPAEDDGHTVYSASLNNQPIYGSAEENTWTGARWEDLNGWALNEDGESCQITYRVVELEGNVPISYTVYDNETTTYEESASAEVLKVTNKLTDVIDYTVTKTWDTGSDILDSSTVLPDYITVKLQYKNADGNWLDVPKNGTATLTANQAEDGTDAWTHVWTNLRADYEYRAVEISVTWTINGKEKTVNVVTGTDETNGTVGSFDYSSEQSKKATKITNKLSETQLTVTKKWDDQNNKDGLRKAVTVKLYRDGSSTEIASATLSADNNWTYTWKNLPMYQNGSETDKSVYTLKEETVSGYTATYSAKSISFDDNGKASVTVTNKHTPKTSTSSKSSTPKTGDNSPISMWLDLLLLAFMAMLGSGTMVYRRRLRR